MAFEHNPYNKEDGSKFVSQTTPTKTETICKVTLSPEFVVPIIFIPGIMGSNLKSKETGEHVWYPPNGRWNGYKASKQGELRTASMRQTELNPETTIVGQDGEINEKDIKNIEKFDIAIARQRGWGSIWWEGYSQILIYLEKHLNQDLIKGTPSDENLNDPDFFAGTKEWKSIVATGAKGFLGMGGDQSKLENIRKEWGPLKEDIELLTKDLHGKLSNYSFPVFAIGYNWLQSNDTSALYVAEMMNRLVKPQIKREFPNQTFKKFIIVTHSMGGLVTRSLIDIASVKNDILGVMHGVMPATGAPTVYQRICRGWEGKEVTGEMADNFAKHIFGATSERLTPVLGNSVGGMQLLPFANFLQHPDRNGNQAKQWLTLRARNRNGTVITARLPESDPYEEIYTRTDTWWSMINKDFLDPNGSLNEKMEEDGKISIMDYYLDNVIKVENFHTKIANSYHHNTYAHYGRDNKKLAYNEILWSTDQILPIDTVQDLIEYQGSAMYGAEKDEPAIEETQVEETQVEETQVENSSSEEPIYGTVTLETVVITAEGHDGFEHLYDEDGLRTIEDKDGNRVTFNIRLIPTSAGDGTVSSESGADVERRNLKQVFVMSGLSHAASYDVKYVHKSTIYSIAKIMEELP